jgi:hypothetical protein
MLWRLIKNRSQKRPKNPQLQLVDLASLLCESPFSICPALQLLLYVQHNKESMDLSSRSYNFAV